MLPDDCVDLVVTSPPYKETDGYSEALIIQLVKELNRVLKPNSLFFLNFGHLAADKFRPFHVCDLAILLGNFKLNDTIVWRKNHFSPIQGKTHLNNLSEFIFVLYKGEMPDLDRLSIGVPYTDPSNAARFNNGVNLRCRGNVWDIPYTTVNNKAQKLHNDRFPEMLPEMCIKLSGIPKGSFVLDPFCGSGTTSVVAKRLGMNSLTFEINENAFKTASLRLNW